MKLCPQCGATEDQGFLPGDTVDNGVGMQKCGPDGCQRCGWIETQTFGDIFDEKGETE
jgi:hypothetical protein